LALPLLAGLITRTLCATIGQGFHARDDYFHVLQPALMWLQDPNFDWANSDVPGAGIRSQLIPRLVWLLLRARESFGITNPETTLTLIGLFLGLYSLSIIPLMAKLGETAGNQTTATFAAWLGALHFAMPYSGTKLLIEAMAMPPLTLGIVLCQRAVGKTNTTSNQTTTFLLLLSGFTVGLACWLRYQVGFAGLGLALAVAIVSKPDRRLFNVAALGIGAAIAITLWGFFDLWIGDGFHGPLIRNITVNLSPHEGLTRSGPWGYVAFLVLLAVPPAALVLLPGAWLVARRYVVISLPILLFVVAHTAIAHKEERFLLPILPLFLVLLAAAPSALSSPTAGGPKWNILKRYKQPAFRLFVGVNAVALILVVSGRSQANQIEAMRRLAGSNNIRAVVSLGPELQAFFLERDDLTLSRYPHVDGDFFRQVTRPVDDRQADPNHDLSLLSFAPDEDAVQVLLATSNLTCLVKSTADGWWLDRLLYRLNPKHNRRRAPIVVRVCGVKS